MQEIQGSKWKRCPSLLNSFGTNHFQRLDGLVLFLQSLGFPSSTLFVTFQASLCDRTFSFFNTVFQPSPILFNISNAQTPVAQELPRLLAQCLGCITMRLLQLTSL
jgi:hypothetical protein